MPEVSANAEQQRAARQQLLLDAAADLELLAQALLLDQPLLVAAQVARQAVEGLGQAPELAAVRHRHLHVEVASGERLRSLRERGEVPRHAPRQRQDAQERHEPEPEPEREVAHGGRADLRERGAHRARDRDHDARVGVGALGHDPVAGVVAGRGVSRHEPEPFEHRLVGRIRRVGTSLGVARERDRTLPPLRPGEDRAQQQAQLVRLGRPQRLAPRLVVRALGSALRPRLHALEPRLELVGDDVDPRRHLGGEVARLGGDRLAERALRALPGVERRPEQRHHGQQEERQGELGPEPHRQSGPDYHSLAEGRCYRSVLSITSAACSQSARETSRCVVKRSVCASIAVASTPRSRRDATASGALCPSSTPTTMLVSTGASFTPRPRAKASPSRRAFA